MVMISDYSSLDMSLIADFNPGDCCCLHLQLAIESGAGRNDSMLLRLRFIITYYRVRLADLHLALRRLFASTKLIARINLSER